MRWNKACSEASPEQKQTHRRFNLYTHTETRGHKSILMKTFKQKKTVDQSRQGDRRVTKNILGNKFMFCFGVQIWKQNQPPNL